MLGVEQEMFNAETRTETIQAGVKKSTPAC
jgi:hypothetical protein